MSGLLDEMAAARAWGRTPEEYFDLPREERALMVASTILERVIDTIESYDAHPPKRR